MCITRAILTFVFFFGIGLMRSSETTLKDFFKFPSMLWISCLGFVWNYIAFQFYEHWSENATSSLLISKTMYTLVVRFKSTPGEVVKFWNTSIGKQFYSHNHVKYTRIDCTGQWRAVIQLYFVDIFSCI